MVDYLSSQLDWAGYQVSTTWGSGPRAEINDFLILLPDQFVAVEIDEGVAWFDPEYWSLEDFLETSFLA